MDCVMEKISELYEKLNEDTQTAWEVYSGETAGDCAAQNGISATQWEHDRMRIARGHSFLAQEMRRGVPTRNETGERILKLITELLNCGLMSLDEDEKRVYLIGALECDGEFQPENTEEKTNEELWDMLLHLIFAWTMDRAIRELYRACDEVTEEVEDAEENEEFPQTEDLYTNPGAMSVASYIAVPETRAVSEALGGISLAVCTCATFVENCKKANQIVDVIRGIGYTMVAAAAITVCSVFMMAGAQAIGAVVIPLAMAENVGSIGAVVSGELGLLSEVYAFWGKLSIGCLGFGVVLEALGDVLNQPAPFPGTYANRKERNQVDVEDDWKEDTNENDVKV